jgi:hypothetical protein
LVGVLSPPTAPQLSRNPERQHQLNMIAGDQVPLTSTSSV